MCVCVWLVGCVPGFVLDNDTEGTFTKLNDLPGGGCISTLAEGTPNAGNGGASEIAVTKDGRFAYAAVRFTGKDNGPPAADGADPDQSGWAVFNQIAIMSLDAETGAAKLVDSVPSGGNMPWTFQLIDNDSKMVCARACIVVFAACCPNAEAGATRRQRHRWSKTSTASHRPTPRRTAVAAKVQARSLCTLVTQQPAR